jgi:hypothetical protein
VVIPKKRYKQVAFISQHHITDNSINSYFSSLVLEPLRTNALIKKAMLIPIVTSARAKRAEQSECDSIRLYVANKRPFIGFSSSLVNNEPLHLQETNSFNVA